MATLRTFESPATTWQLTWRKSLKDLDLVVSIPFLYNSNRLIFIIVTVYALCEVLSEALQVIQRNLFIVKHTVLSVDTTIVLI
jgi:hypothetical protein